MTTIDPTYAQGRAALSRTTPMFDLSHKNALVTGANGGIGRGIAVALARCGANVAVNFVSNARQADEVCREIENLGPDAIALEADISNAKEATALVAKTKNVFGGIDIVVNNAGILTFEPFLDIKESSWDRILDVNLKGAFLVGQAAARLMEEQARGGRIINIASIASGQVGVGYPNVAHYAASKGGLIALTETMAVELGRYGITVNAIAPGVIETDMTRTLVGQRDALQSILARVPMGRVGRPEDVGALAAFLASNEASYCTGATFYVDGGWLAG